MTIIQDLGGGLVLRHATPDDIEALADFNSYIHKDFGTTDPANEIGWWTRDLMRGTHPTTQASDFLIVEDTRRGAIASTTSLISQVWKYGGIPFKVGRPELVATNADYRNKGLVRAQFDVLHRWSAERGELAQAITGIRYYYRQFGYEMTLNMPARRVGYRINIPALKEGEPEPFALREATDDDIPFIMDLVAEGDKRYFITLQTDETYWRYQMHHLSEGSYLNSRFCIITMPDGKPIGALGHTSKLSRGAIAVSLYELAQGVRWAAVTPTVLRYLGKMGEQYEERALRDKKPAFGAYVFELGDTHPVYDIIRSRLPRKTPSYTYFMRVPDIPAFIRHVAPVFEDRLAGSIFAGHTGELKFNFYRNAFKMTFAEGKVGAESYTPTHQDDGDVFFPAHTFLHLLFAHLELDDLERVFPDCWAASDEARALTKTLFPRQDSLAIPLS
jgi:hypothetical protein